MSILTVYLNAMAVSKTNDSPFTKTVNDILVVAQFTIVFTLNFVKS